MCSGEGIEIAETSTALAIVAIFLAGAIVKGLVGIGLPTLVIGVLSQTSDPRFAIALVLVPMMASNALQTIRSGYVIEAIKGYWKLYIPMIVALPIFAQLSTLAVAETMKLAVGLFIVLFVVTNALTARLHFSKKHDSVFQIAFGSAAGIMGGLAAMTAPPLVMYLAGRRLPKQEFVGVVGLFLFASSVMLTLGYVRARLTSPMLLGVSALLVGPVAVGMWIGEHARQYLNEDVFRRVVLLVFFLLGLNLIRVSIGLWT